MSERARADCAGGPAPGRERSAIFGRMRSLVLAAAAMFAAVAPSAQAQTGVRYAYERCAAVGEASVVGVAGATCAEAEAVAARVVAEPTAAAGATLKAAGWTPLRARSTGNQTEYDLVAVRNGAALRLRRPGAAPDLDGWEAGREPSSPGRRSSAASRFRRARPSARRRSSCGCPAAGSAA